jgi:hypothetical protein
MRKILIAAALAGAAPILPAPGLSAPAAAASTSEPASQFGGFRSPQKNRPRSEIKS